MDVGLACPAFFRQSDCSHYTAMCENNEKVAKYGAVDEWGAKRKGKNQPELYDVEVLKRYKNLCLPVQLERLCRPFQHALERCQGTKM